MDSLIVQEIKQVIRGEKPWINLRVAGVKIAFDNDECKVEGTGNVVVVPSVFDICSGLLRFRNDPVALKQWAAVLLAASSVIDLRELESDPIGNTLLEAIWDASAGAPIKQSILELAELEMTWRSRS